MITSAIHVIVIVKAKYLVKSHLELQKNGRIGAFMSPVSLLFHTIVDYSEIDLKDRIGIRLPVHHIRFPCSNKQVSFLPASFQATQHKQISRHLLFNSCLKFTLKVLHKLVKGYPIFQTKVHEPYPELNGGQIRCARGLSESNRYIYEAIKVKLTFSA